MKRARTLTKKERKALQCDAKLAREVIDAVKTKPPIEIENPKIEWLAIDDLFKKKFYPDDHVDAAVYGWAGVDRAQDIINGDCEGEEHERQARLRICTAC